MTIQAAIKYMQKGNRLINQDMEIGSYYCLSDDGKLNRVHPWGTFIDMKFTLEQILREDWEILYAEHHTDTD